MTVQEAGRKGGMIGGRKGGETVLRERGPQFYSEIGKKGGARVRELIERAKLLEAEEAATATTRRRRTTSR
jgi:general stress protein YciG